METLILIFVLSGIGAFLLGWILGSMYEIKKHTKKITQEIEDMKYDSYTCYLRDEVELNTYEYGIGC